MGTLIVCDVCKTNSVNIAKYGLRRYTPARKAVDEPVGKFVSTGSIYMCLTCWTRIAKPHMVPSRKPKTSRNQHTEAETVGIWHKEYCVLPFEHTGNCRSRPYDAALDAG